MASDDFRILSPVATATVNHAADHSVVTVSGELDESAADACAALVSQLAAQDGPVHLDLSAVTFFSAAGVTWLASLYQTAPGEVRIVAASEPVREVLSLCGVPTTSRSNPQSPRQRSIS